MNEYIVVLAFAFYSVGDRLKLSGLLADDLLRKGYITVAPIKNEDSGAHLNNIVKIKPLRGRPKKDRAI